MFRLSILITVFLVLSAHCLFSQQQAAIWYFYTGAGIDFRSGNPISLTDGQILGRFGFGEGSASICNDRGELLFYTDGVTVYNRLHAVMSNGSNLWGHHSTTQTLIVPQPGNDSIFYIFTLSPEYNSVFAADSVGCHYSIVNMNFNGGLGKVTQKNILLFKKTTEKVSAIHQRNGTGIWVVFHEWESSCFRSYLITETGIELTPVVSCVGSFHFGGRLGRNSNAAGQMKISPDGKLLALVMSGSNRVEIFFFDDNSGRVTGLFDSFTFPTANRIGQLYGVEFSADGKFLYYTYGFWGGPGCGVNIAEDPGEVWQYSIAKKQSKRVGTFVGSLNAMQLGPDGRIYIARCNDIARDSEHLAVINNPSREGPECNFASNGVYLGGRKVSFGLPGFVQSFFRFEEPVVEMPNAFSPNGDAFNPVFKPITFSNILDADLKIINRWGQEIFYTRNVLTGWDGGNSSTGIYYWFLRYEGLNGKIKTAKGWVHLMR